MTRLINLLSWLPGHSGFGSYVQRVVPGIDGLRLQVGQDSQVSLFTPEQWSAEPPAWASGRMMRFLQRYSLVQHSLDLSALLQRDGIKLNQIEAIYSPFFDALLCCPEVPQLITCHDLTPLVASNSRKAWLRYRLWQPRHCQCATRLIAISRYVADQLVEFGVKPDRIEVIPNGIEILRPPVLTPHSQDLLVLARHDVNKNLPALFRGVSPVATQLPPVAWCIAHRRAHRSPDRIGGAVASSAPPQGAGGADRWAIAGAAGFLFALQHGSALSQY